MKSTKNQKENLMGALRGITANAEIVIDHLKNEQRNIGRDAIKAKIAEVDHDKAFFVAEKDIPVYGLKWIKQQGTYQSEIAELQISIDQFRKIDEKARKITSAIIIGQFQGEMNREKL